MYDKHFFKKTIKNKPFMISFIIFSILSGAFVGFPLMVSLSNGFTFSMINNLMWLVTFSVYMVVLLILLMILKSIIFDNDMNFLIKIEIQYRVKKITIFFTRYLVLTVFAFIYITLILICYFIYTSILVKDNMNYSIFIGGTIGYVAYLYLFAFGTIAILFLTSFIKNNGLKFSLPFIILLSFSAMNVYSQFVLVPNNTNDSFQGFASAEKQFLNYDKFQSSNFSSLYNSAIKSENLDAYFKTLNLYVNQHPTSQDYNKYDIFVRHHFFSSSPDEINYNKNNRTISDIYHDLAQNSTTPLVYKQLFNCLSNLFQNFELNNMFNIYLLQTNSVDPDYYGFLNSQTYVTKTYKKGSYTMSIDEFLAQRFINLASQYSAPVKSQYVNNFKSQYNYFKNELRTWGYCFFWLQPGYLLSGTMSNISNDLDRSLLYMESAPMSQLLNFTFSGDNSSGYKIINKNIESTYSYSFLVIEYTVIIIILLNYISYVLFSRKIIQ